MKFEQLDNALITPAESAQMIAPVEEVIPTPLETKIGDTWRLDATDALVVQ